MIRHVVTRGFGNGVFNGTIPLVVVRGYGGVPQVPTDFIAVRGLLNAQVPLRGTLNSEVQIIGIAKIDAPLRGILNSNVQLVGILNSNVPLRGRP